MIFFYLLTACGQRFHKIQNNQTIYFEPNTTFNSDLQMDTYANDVVCVYSFAMTSLGDLIVLRIIHFSLEKDYDFLIIGTGKDSSDFDSVLVKLTGKPKLHTLASTDSDMWLTFLSDLSGQSSGYQLTITLYPENLIDGIN